MTHHPPNPVARTRWYVLTGALLIGALGCQDRDAAAAGPEQAHSEAATSSLAPPEVFIEFSRTLRNASSFAELVPFLSSRLVAIGGTSTEQQAQTLFWLQDVWPSGTGVSAYHDDGATAELVIDAHYDGDLAVDRLATVYLVLEDGAWKLDDIEELLTE